jgi:hypothetical protein
MNNVWILVIDGAPIHFAPENGLQSLKDCVFDKSHILGDDIRGCRWSMKADGILHLESKGWLNHEYQLHRVEEVYHGVVEPRRSDFRPSGESHRRIPA